MRVNHLNYVPMLGTRVSLNASTFESLVQAGTAIEVTTWSGKYFPAGRVAIESSVYERHVAWNSKSMRHHRMYLEESTRLFDLLRAASMATRHETPAEFCHRVVATDDTNSLALRHSFVLQRFDVGIRSGWLIRQ